MASPSLEWDILWICCRKTSISVIHFVSIPQIILHRARLTLTKSWPCTSPLISSVHPERGMNCGWMELIVAMVGPCHLNRGFCRVPARPSSSAWSSGPWTCPSRTEQGKIKADRAGFHEDWPAKKTQSRQVKDMSERRTLGRAWHEQDTTTHPDLAMVFNCFTLLKGWMNCNVKHNIYI